MPQTENTLRTAQGICRSLLQPLRGPAAVHLPTSRETKTPVGQELARDDIFKKKNSLPKDKAEEKDPVDESGQTILCRHTHPTPSIILFPPLLYPSFVKEFGESGRDRKRARAREKTITKI